jgi:mono/diheme cytochrome c family protein
MKTTNPVLACLAGGFVLLIGPRLGAATPEGGALAWDADTKDYTSKPGERYANFTFWFTNTSSAEVTIHSAQSSCFCTVAKLPQQPWRIGPGSNGPIQVTMDLAGKNGTVMKAVTVDSTTGRKTLLVKTTVTPAPAQAGASMNEADRSKNMQTALADRQAIFKKAECASCHAEPAKGKSGGAELYAAVCSSCHDSPQRASTVPDLRALPHAPDAADWKTWIRYGRAGSMMPAFAQSEGGPLEDRQIVALSEYLVKAMPTRVSAGTPAPANAGGFAVPVAR